MSSTNATIKVSEPLYFEGSAVADAISQYDIETFRSLLAKDSHLVNRVDKNTTYTAIHMACSSDSIPERFAINFVSLLLENGTDMNATLVEECLTPLHKATSRGKVDIIRVLLENRADVTAVTTLEYTTALQY